MDGSDCSETVAIAAPLATSVTRRGWAAESRRVGYGEQRAISDRVDGESDVHT